MIPADELEVRDVFLIPDDKDLRHVVIEAPQLMPDQHLRVRTTAGKICFFNPKQQVELLARKPR